MAGESTFDLGRMRVVLEADAQDAEEKLESFGDAITDASRSAERGAAEIQTSMATSASMTSQVMRGLIRPLRAFAPEVITPIVANVLNIIAHTIRYIQVAKMVALTEISVAAGRAVLTKASWGLATAQTALFLGNVKLLPALAMMAAAFAPVVAIIAAAAAVAYVFYRAGRAIGDRLFDIRDAADKAADSFTELIKSQEFDPEKARNRMSTLKDAVRDLDKSYVELQENIKKVNDTEADPKARIEATAKVKALQAGIRETNDAAREVLNSSRVQYQSLLATLEEGQKKLTTTSFNQKLSVESFAGMNPKEVEKRVALYHAQATAEGQAATAAQKFAAAMGNNAEKAQEMARSYIEMTATIKHAEATIINGENAINRITEQQLALTDAMLAGKAAQEGFTKRAKELSRSVESLSMTPHEKEMARFVTMAEDVEDELKKVSDIVNEINRSALFAGGLTDEAREIRDELNETIKSMQALKPAIDAAKGKAEGDEEKRRVQARREALTDIQQMEVDSLRHQEKLREADELAAQLRFERALQRVQEMRSSADAQIRSSANDAETAARRLYDSELESIERNDRKRREANEAFQQIKEREETRIRESEKLAEASIVRQQIAQAQIVGDVRTEATLRARLTELLRESGNEMDALLDKDQSMTRNVRERVALLRDELESRARMGGKAGEFADIARKAQSDLAGSSSAIGLRGVVRQRFADTETKEGAKELFEGIKKALEVEFIDLQNARQQAVKGDDVDAIENIDKSMNEVAEKFRIVSNEFNRALKEIGARGATPARPAVTSTERLKDGAIIPEGATILRDGKVETVAQEETIEKPGEAATRATKDAAKAATDAVISEDMRTGSEEAVQAVSSIEAAITKVSDATNQLTSAIISTGDRATELLTDIFGKMNEAVLKLNDHERFISTMRQNLVGVRIENRL
jgi:hypothetical protein